MGINLPSSVSFSFNAPTIHINLKTNKQTNKQDKTQTAHISENV